jgi:hypothetical protein
MRMNFAVAMDHLAAENIGVIKAKLFQSTGGRGWTLNVTA